MTVIPQTKNQTVPTEFAAILRDLYDNKDPRLPLTLSVARMNGWNLQALATPLGITRERVRQIVAAADASAPGKIPNVPPGPVVKTPPRKPPTPRLRVRPEVADHLREMQSVAKKVNGGTPADAPERKVSEQLTSELAALVEQGVAIKHLARVLGVTHFAVSSRLARHGHRPLYPSQATTAYLGHATYEGPNGKSTQTECKYGHPLAGENLYITPRGNRECKECVRRRQREYQARKRAAQAGEAL